LHKECKAERAKTKSATEWYNIQVGCVKK
jgi:hypothetical protein